MQTKSFLWLVATLTFALSGCQSAKKPATSLAGQPQNSPPRITVPAPSASTHTSSPAPAAPAAPPQSQSQKPETKTKPDPVAELIAKVESEYQAGREKSSAGQNDAAKEHFDRAFKMLMGSPAEMRSDPQFQHEFDRVQDGVNKLEAAALPPAPHNATEKTETETEEEQKSEPAPIDEANEVTNYPADPNLKAKVKAEVKATRSDLPLMMTDQVAGYINYFSTRGRGTLEHALVRSGRYREMIERTLREEGVPQDLIYLAQAESGFHPYAVSRAGARGIWQFMGSRARGYDLHHDLWMDERQDPEKSTRAAARHLKDLYNQFGDWYLAMAAYNSGPGTVQSAVKRTGYADFWELYRRNVLPKETRNYVPIIVAVTIMAKNPSQYGLDSITPDPQMAYDTVKISYPVDLRLVADCVGASPEELQELNPSLLRMSTPRLTTTSNTRDRFDLHLPIGTSAKYQTAIALIPPDMRLWWRYYTVAPGDTLMSVARKYRTTTRTIAEANQLEASADLEAGAKLIIPVSPGKHGSGEVEVYAKRTTVYRIRKNDTVQTVSDNLGISPLTIRRWNGLKSNSLSGRRVLYVHLPVSPTAATSEHMVAHKSRSSSKLRTPKQTSSGAPVRHTVKPGETLYSIANSYKTSVNAIKQTNTNVATLRPGMVLIIPAR